MIARLVAVAVILAFLYVGHLWTSHASLLPGRPARRPGAGAGQVDLASDVEEIIAGAHKAYDAYVETRRNLATLAEHALKRPMQARPGPPAPAPGEPWQLRHGADPFPSGLVEPGVPNETVDGDPS